MGLGWSGQKRRITSRISRDIACASERLEAFKASWWKPSKDFRSSISFPTAKESSRLVETRSTLEVSRRRSRAVKRRSSEERRRGFKEVKSAFSRAAAIRRRRAEVSDRAPSQARRNCRRKRGVLLEQSSHGKNSLAGDRGRANEKTQGKSCVPQRSQRIMLQTHQIASQLP